MRFSLIQRPNSNICELPSWYRCNLRQRDQDKTSGARAVLCSPVDQDTTSCCDHVAYCYATNRQGRVLAPLRSELLLRSVGNESFKSSLKSERVETLCANNSSQVQSFFSAILVFPTLMANFEFSVVFLIDVWLREWARGRICFN